MGFGSRACVLELDIDSKDIIKKHRRKKFGEINAIGKVEFKSIRILNF